MKEAEREYQIARGAVWEMKRVKQAGSDHITTIAALAEKAKESPWGTILKQMSSLKIFPSVWVSSLIKYTFLVRRIFYLYQNTRRRTTKVSV